MKISTVLNGLALASAGSNAAAAAHVNARSLLGSISSSVTSNTTTTLSPTTTEEASHTASSSCSGGMTYMGDPPEFTYTTTTITVTVTGEASGERSRPPTYMTNLPPCLTKYHPCPQCPAPPNEGAEKTTMILVTKKTEVYAPLPTDPPPSFATTTNRPIPLRGPAPKPTSSKSSSDAADDGLASAIISAIEDLHPPNSKQGAEPTGAPGGEPLPSDTTPLSEPGTGPKPTPELLQDPSSGSKPNPTSNPVPNTDKPNNSPGTPNSPDGTTATIDGIPVTVLNPSTVVFGSQTIPLIVPATGEPSNKGHDGHDDNNGGSNHSNNDDDNDVNGDDDVQGVTTVITSKGHTYTINPSEIIAPTTTFEFEPTSKGTASETPTSGNKDKTTTASTTASQTASGSSTTETTSTSTSPTETQSSGATPTSGDDGESLGVRGVSTFVSVYGGSAAVLLAMIVAL